MTPKEFKVAITALAKEIGPRAELWASIGIEGDHPLTASVYPTGMCGSAGCAFRVEADDFDELIVTLRTKWAEHKDRYHAEMVRKMALEIIRLTAEHGECTDAALRAVFNPGDVAFFGPDAIADANKIASNGPFSITAVKGANAA